VTAILSLSKERKFMFKFIYVTLIITLAAAQSFAAGSPQTEAQKTFYSIGAYQARQIAMFSLTPAEYDMVLQGFADSAPGKKPAVDVEKYSKKVQELAQARRADKAAKADDKKVFESIGAYQARQLAMFYFTPEEYEMVRQGFSDSAPGKKPVVDIDAYSKKVRELAKAAAQKGALKTDSGLIFFSLRKGTGASPAATDTVKIHYRGTLIDGKEFDNTTYTRKPAEFKLDSVIKCWTEGLQKMKAGGKGKLVCPAELAYGSKGVDTIVPPDATLIFEVELLEVKKP
jgi:FKBP-type peptidyl-prolyl cis-trans isomerase FkpA